MRVWVRAVTFAALAAVTATACIDESDAGIKSGKASVQSSAEATGTDAGARTAVTATLSEWTIALSRQTVPHGTVTFTVRNNGTEDHAFEVEGAGQEWKTEAIKPGESATLSAAMPAGAYDVYCPLASGGEAHADRGMKVTVRVE
jgi:uncharacterized cupredoxin-like copper-binding protein